MNERLINLLSDIIQSRPENPNSQWLYFDCPFCHHHKPKFAFNVNTHVWKCWVCQTRGISIFSLLRRLNKWHLRQRVNTTIEHIPQKRLTVQQTANNLSLPREFIPLNSSKEFLLKKKALRYLEKRDVGGYQIQKYNIGCCTSGIYADRVIIPSYNESGNLNYFVARSMSKYQDRKYMNPRCERKKIIMFENLINWNFPIILTQGVFDAITVNFNAIPLLGKIINDTLIQKILYYDADVYLSLDNDARVNQQKILSKLYSYGLQNIYYVNLKDKDPSQMGREQYWQYLFNNKEKYTQISKMQIMKNKLKMS